MTVFLGIGLIGIVLLTLSLVFGEVFDGALGSFDSDWISGAAGSAFISAFGFGGAVVVGAGGTVVAIAAGIVSGALFAWFAGWLVRLLRGGGTDETPGPQDAVGHEASVVTGIPADGFGVVTVRVGGHLLRFNASADVALEAGTPVHVTAVLSPTAVSVAPVHPVDALESP